MDEKLRDLLANDPGVDPALRRVMSPENLLREFLHDTQAAVNLLENSMALVRMHMEDKE
jgi:hypothetical protein